MTPRTEQQPQMSVEEFEELERHAPETVRLEFISGKVQVKGVTDGNHDTITAWLQRLCMQHRPELWLYGHGDWSDADGVLMVVEVTSHDSDTHQRDRVEKPGGYAAAGIPVYLLIDRDEASVIVFNQPEDGRYLHWEGVRGLIRVPTVPSRRQ
ncbi:Uma2 family endonuclease [Streptomyces sp. NPDC057257]|uniref:Uma2 family endonuclease n=1 Tax=Streptomyces sp. NPDC057257 TaxID=3346071 RepID=UPI0036335AE8